MRWSAVAVLSVAVAVAPARAEDDEDIRRDFDALIRRIEEGPQPDADSPTAIVNRLVSVGDAELRPVLEKAWRIAASRRDAAPERETSVSWAVRLLYGRVSRHPEDDPHGRSIVADDGVVRIRPLDIEFGARPASRKAPSTFALLVEGGVLRAPSQFDRTKLLSQAATAAADECYSGALDDFARALGEACAGDAQSVRRLLVLADRPELESMLIPALAWSKSPEAVQSLCRRLSRFARTFTSGGSTTELFTACPGLVHADPAALAQAIRSLPIRDQQDEAWVIAGLDVAAPYLCEWLDTAATPTSRAAALRRIASIVNRSDYFPAAKAVGSMAARLDIELKSEDEFMRRAAVLAAEALLAGGTRPLSYSSADPSGSFSQSAKGVEIRPYPGGLGTLRAWAADRVSGRITYVRPRPSAFDESIQPASTLDVQVSPDRADVPLDAKRRRFDASLRLRSAFEAGGLSLTLTNVGDSEVSVNPVAFRYARAQVVTETVSSADAPKRTYSRLNLVFGSLQHVAVVDASLLVVLAPGKSFAWTTEIRPQDRTVDHVGISLEYDIRVRGRPPALLVTHFRDVWVK